MTGTTRKDEPIRNDTRQSKTIIEDDIPTKIILCVSIMALTGLGVFVLKNGLLEILG